MGTKHVTLADVWKYLLEKDRWLVYDSYPSAQPTPWLRTEHSPGMASFMDGNKSQKVNLRVKKVKSEFRRIDKQTTKRGELRWILLPRDFWVLYRAYLGVSIVDSPQICELSPTQQLCPTYKEGCRTRGSATHISKSLESVALHPNYAVRGARLVATQERPPKQSTQVPGFWSAACNF